jgi:hypothetical protein
MLAPLAKHVKYKARSPAAPAADRQVGPEAMEAAGDEISNSLGTVLSKGCPSRVREFARPEGDGGEGAEAPGGGSSYLSLAQLLKVRQKSPNSPVREAYMSRKEACLTHVAADGAAVIDVVENARERVHLGARGDCTAVEPGGMAQ